MEIVKDVVLVLHFVGLASLLGGFLVQMSSKDKTISMAMVHGALTQLVTGVALVGLRYGLDQDVNNPKITTKLVILLVVTALVFRYRGRDKAPVGVWGAIGALTLAEVAIAVIW